MSRKAITELFHILCIKNPPHFEKPPSLNIPPFDSPRLIHFRSYHRIFNSTLHSSSTNTNRKSQSLSRSYLMWIRIHNVDCYAFHQLTEDDTRFITYTSVPTHKIFAVSVDLSNIVESGAQLQSMASALPTVTAVSLLL